MSSSSFRWAFSISSQRRVRLVHKGLDLPVDEVGGISE